jgi:glycosyltransferase involved in cell wall biosynthesis
MKILILIQCTNLGGMEHNMLLLIDELRKLNIDSEVVSIVPVGAMGQKLKDRNIPVSGGTYRGPGGIFSFFELRNILKSKKADALLMIGHNLMAELSLGRLWKGRRIISIHYHHGGVKPQLVWKLIYWVAYRRFRTFFFVSDYIKEEALKAAPFLKRRSLIVSTQVKTHSPFTQNERREARADFKIPPDVLLVGNAGWLIERKRWDVFLKVASKVVHHDHTVRFVIAGDGPLRDELHKLAHELRVSENIIWLGWQSDLLPFYRSIDVLLFNSDWDAQARTPLEAMSYGIPVVASLLEGGSREIIAESSMGILLGAHDIDKMAEEILKMVRDPNCRIKMGNAGRQRVLEYASPSRHAQRVLTAFGWDHEVIPK